MDSASQSTDAVTDNGAPIAESVPGQSARLNRPGSVRTINGGFAAWKGATLAGRVVLAGTPPPEIRITFGPSTETCGAYYPTGVTTRHYLVSPSGGLANVVVYIKSGLENYTFPVPAEPAIIENFGCFFEPYVSAAQVGQKIQFRNLDSFMHGIHCTPKNNKEFNFAEPAAGIAKDFTFNAPEISIRVKCDVHEWEFAYISVLPHPFFAVSDAEGNYRFPASLPPGEYTVGAYHARAGELVQPLTVGGSQTKPLIFTFQLPPRLSRL